MIKEEISVRRLVVLVLGYLLAMLIWDASLELSSLLFG